MPSEWTRRQWLGRTPAALGAALVVRAHESAAADAAPAEPFGYCLNTSTLQGQKLDLVEIVEIAAKAGYTALEPWVREVDDYVKKGGDLKALRQRLQDRGLSVESAIGFSEWIVDDAGRRKKGLEQARRDMERVRQVGGKRLAAPPAGAQQVERSEERRVGKEC